MPMQELRVAVGRLLAQQSRIKRMRIAYFAAVHRLVLNTSVWSDVYNGDTASLLRQEGLCAPSTYEAFVAVLDTYGRPTVDAIGVDGCSRITKQSGTFRDQIVRTALRRAATVGRCLSRAELSEVILDVLAENQPARGRPRPGPVNFNPPPTTNVSRENNKLIREIAKLRQDAMMTGRAGAVEAVLYTHLPAIVNLLREASRPRGAGPTQPSAPPPC